MKTPPVSYLYFGTGLVLALYHFVSGQSLSLNIRDTYYVVSANLFALALLFFYLVPGTMFLVIERYLNFRVKIVQYLAFNIPFIYFLFVDPAGYSPRMLFERPLLFKWLTVYIPLGLLYCFLLSIVLVFVLFFLAFRKWLKSRKAKV